MNSRIIDYKIAHDEIKKWYSNLDQFIIYNSNNIDCIFDVYKIGLSVLLNDEQLEKQRKHFNIHFRHEIKINYLQSKGRSDRGSVINIETTINYDISKYFTDKLKKWK